MERRVERRKENAHLREKGCDEKEKANQPPVVVTPSPMQLRRDPLAR